MSTKAVSWVLHNVRVEPITKMILVSMAENADENGICWPSQSSTATKACVSLATVKRKIKWLEEQKVLSVIRRRVGSHKTQNKYRLHLDQVFNLMGSATVQASSDPDFDSVSLTPSEKPEQETDGISLTPSIGSHRHHQAFEGVTGDTIDSVTCDTQNHHLTITSSNTALNTTEASLFDSKPVPSRQRITLTTDWRPSEHVFEKLNFTRGITREFAQQQLDGFVLYHDGTTDRQQAFDSRFHSHVIRNWEMTKTEAKPIAKSWRPDELTVRRLRQAGIPEDFIDERSIEFVIFWLENGKADTGWNAKFYESVLKVWNRAVGDSQAATAGALAVRQSVSKATPVTMKRTIDKLTDRSWAEG